MKTQPLSTGKVTKHITKTVLSFVGLLLILTPLVLIWYYLGSMFAGLIAIIIYFPACFKICNSYSGSSIQTMTNPGLSNLPYNIHHKDD